MAAVPHQLFLFAIENDDNDLIYLILINEHIILRGHLNFSVA